MWGQPPSAVQPGEARLCEGYSKRLAEVRTE
jgi:hypothetical protein